jgi:hypothetical protein
MAAKSNAGSAIRRTAADADFEPGKTNDRLVRESRSDYFATRAFFQSIFFMGPVDSRSTRYGTSAMR